MDNLLLILIETSIALLLFYGVYFFWLRHETMFFENRFYLLGSAIFSLVVPWFDFTISNPTSDPIMIYNLLEVVTITATGYELTLLQTLSTAQWIGLVYIAGAIVMLAVFVIKLVWLTRIDAKAEKANGLLLPPNVRLIKSEVVPFSFLNKIYLNPKSLNLQQMQHIVAHERVHIKEQHTYDCLFYELLIVVLWFNPIVYKYRASAKAIHEFLADEGAIKSGISGVEYQTLLYEQATGLKLMPLANSFNYSLVKRRLIMLTKIKSSKWARIRLLYVVPVLLVAVMVFACQKSQPESDKTQNKSAEGSIAPEEVFFEVEDMPEYPGGDSELRNFIAQNVKYPNVAKENGIQGRVFVQFVVNKSGKVEQVKVVRGVDPSLDNEALRVVSLMPDWKPGKQDGKAVNVSFTVPINFLLQ